MGLHPASSVLPTNSVRLACVKHAASVRSEPGSNSHLISCLLKINYMTCSLVFKEQYSLYTFTPYDLKGTRKKYATFTAWLLQVTGYYRHTRKTLQPYFALLG